jgi:hypothetical protein
MLVWRDEDETDDDPSMVTPASNATGCPPEISEPVEEPIDVDDNNVPPSETVGELTGGELKTVEEDRATSPVPDEVGCSGGISEKVREVKSKSIKDGDAPPSETVGEVAALVVSSVSKVTGWAADDTTSLVEGPGPRGVAATKGIAETETR